ncbi:hypothetical protein A6M27_17555 [Acidithiobacillus thiooxidans]|uniref:AAA+ ATPase domain-containing protein n=2 Tax=Acidithiobacillus thiooxidans TaxID=930 RepID=A0A1C2INR7_ACITH|nr:AAA family ATPase [Acidithiobacillus thiooxidans]OCX68481.1 hypothetical protein A6P07_18090 [Acidithiobacillus thiooxidans]OCX77662.1 hypothetical protein A6O26_19335 [Acidithiobacillus thiooxidans]OCX83384.1 hypothetical protein A6M27_17555 [Acidithiobacillus thiooxidans]
MQTQNMNHLNVRERKTVAELFGGTVPHEVDVLEGSHHVPSLSETYKIREDLRGAMLYWLFGPKDNLYIHGPTGAGKSSLVEQTAARLGREVFKVSCHERMEFMDFTGLYIKGGHEFVEGPLVQAMKRGGLVLFDEMDQLPPSTLIGLNGVLDGKPLLVPETGELIEPHPLFRVVGTGNSAGSGDISRNYKSVKAQNVALLDRFTSLAVGYLEPEDELQVLQATIVQKDGTPALDAEITRAMIRVANDVRDLFLNSRQTGMNHTITTRTLLRWAQRAVAFAAVSKFPVMEALAPAFLNRLDGDQAESVKGICMREFGRNL